jgi:hypothetical protein
MTCVMAHRIFFSWQSDTPNAVGRTMIEACLERAIGTLRADAEIDLADRELSVDKDTLHVPGSPPIVETIYGKIDQAAVFLSDLTYVALRPNGGGIPNPNVSIEHGWALKSLSSRRVISVMNTAMGHPDKHELPFDLRHVRRPICYACPPDADADGRRQAKDDLSKQLVVALKAIFGDEAIRTALRPSAPAEPDTREAGAAAALQELAFDMNRGALPEIVSQPRLTLRLAPFSATENRRLDPRTVAQRVLGFPPSPHDRVKTDSDGRQWWSCAMPRRLQAEMNPETSWRMRLVRPGYLEYQVTIGRRIGDDPQILVDGRRLEAHIVRNLERMAAIAIDLDLAGPALVLVSLDGTEDVELTRARPGGRRIRQPEIILPLARLGDLAAPVAESLHEQLDILWQAAGWGDGSPRFLSATASQSHCLAASRRS